LPADLITRSQTVGVPNSEFDQYGGYDAVKNVYDASGGAGAGAGAGAVETINLPTRTTPPNVDTTNLFTSTGGTRAVTGPQLQIMTTLTTFIKRILEGMQVLKN
jgi:hypothetical protein